MTPQDLHATVLHALGVPMPDPTKIAVPEFSTGEPVMNLFG